jgi:hypothetical protein
MKLNIKACAFTVAILWGAVVFLYTWWIMVLEGATGEITFLGRIYLGYAITPKGSLIGLCWALIDGLILGALFAWLYNLFNKGSTTSDSA